MNSYCNKSCINDNATKHSDEKIEHIAKFISGIWQIHAFREGNTQTTAIFTIQYLRSLGMKLVVILVGVCMLAYVDFDFTFSFIFLWKGLSNMKKKGH